MSEQPSAHLIWASQGEYSDRQEWPVAFSMDKAAAESATERLGQLRRELCQIYAKREDELDEAGDLMGATLYETLPEGREFVSLSAGMKPAFQRPDWDDLTFTCCEVPALAATDPRP